MLGTPGVLCAEALGPGLEGHLPDGGTDPAHPGGRLNAGAL